MLVNVLAGIQLAVFIAIGWVLVRKFRRTRDIGFLLLSLGLLVWPAMSRVLSYGERIMIDQLVAGEQVTLFPFSIAAEGKMSIGSLIVILASCHNLVHLSLLLVGVAFLCTKCQGAGNAADAAPGSTFAG